MAGLRQPGGNSPAGSFGASNGNWQARCRVEPCGGASCKHDCAPVAARPFFTARAFYDGRRHRGRRSAHCRSASRTGGAAPRALRHADGCELAGRRLSRRRDQIGCCNRDATLCRGHARTRRRVAIAAAVRVDRYRRHCRRMADLGSYSRTAAVDQRHRRDDARGVRAHGALADRSANMAASAAQHDRAPAAVAVVAPPRGSGRSRLPRPSRRARNHRVGIGFVFVRWPAGTRDSGERSKALRVEFEGTSPVAPRWF